MAGQMKLFYGGLTAIAVVGVGLIFLARTRGAERTTPQAVAVDAAAAAFEGHVMGSDSAPITVVEYADFECGACAQFAILTAPDVKQRLVATGQVRWVFRDFPLEGFRNSLAAHHAAQCAGEQGRFFEMHDQIYFNRGRWVSDRRPDRRFREFAAAIRLDMGRYDDCTASGRYRSRLERAKQDAVAAGVGSTPTFDIGGQRVSGALNYDDFKRYVDRAIAGAAAQ
jgi:protein-disulfide isomerase